MGRDGEVINRKVVFFCPKEGLRVYFCPNSAFEGGSQFLGTLVSDQFGTLLCYMYQQTRLFFESDKDLFVKTRATMFLLLLCLHPYCIDASVSSNPQIHLSNLTTL